MRNYKVISGNIVGIYGKVFTMNSEIKECQLRPGHAEILVGRGRLKEITDHAIRKGEKIRLAIVTSVWGRPEVVQMFFAGIKNLIDNCKEFEISLIISESIQDYKEYELENGYQTSNLMTWLLDSGLKHGRIIEIPNEPLYAKVNASTYECRKLNVHYVLCMGSDDIISPELLNEYEPHMRRGIDFIGVNDCYFYDTVSGKSIYWGGYLESHRKGASCGAFRAISASLMDKVDWMPWDYSRYGGLDYTMIKKFSKINHSKHVFSMRENGLFGVDIKSEINITKFRLWDNSQNIDSKILLDKFPYLKK